MDDLEIKINELTENPSTRVPVCLCLDVSGSMGGKPIQELNQGIVQFFAEIKNDKLARFSADICIVTFGANVTKLVDFRAIDQQSVPHLSASGSTPMGQAVNLALDSLEFRKKEYQTVGVDYYQPWLVLMTDGQPTDDISLAASRVNEMLAARRLTVFPIGIGPNADMNQLRQFSPQRDPLRLKGLEFSEFFTWLSKSIVRTSVSSLGEKVDLPPVNGWATL